MNIVKRLKSYLGNILSIILSKCSERIEKERVQLLCENKEKEVLSATIKQIEAEQYFKSLIENYEEMVNSNSNCILNKDLETQVRLLFEENEELNKRIQQLNVTLYQKDNDIQSKLKAELEKRIQSLVTLKNKYKNTISEAIKIKNEILELKSEYKQTLDNQVKECVVQLTVIFNIIIGSIEVIAFRKS